MLGVRPGDKFCSTRARQASDAIYIPTITHHSATADRVLTLQVSSKYAVVGFRSPANLCKRYNRIQYMIVLI